MSAQREREESTVSAQREWEKAQSAKRQVRVPLPQVVRVRSLPTVVRLRGLPLVTQVRMKPGKHG